MIKIYITYTNILFQNISLEHYYKTLPDNLLGKVKRYIKMEDRKLHLASILLLRKALEDNGYERKLINKMDYNKTGRPFIEDCSFDFNISHTENCAAVVFSEEQRIGIDIEKIKEIDFSDFENYLSEELWENINSSENKSKTFYDYWTLLESASKADGRGLSIFDDKKFKITNDGIIIENTEWYSVYRHFDPSISCCVTSNKIINEIDIIEIKSI